MRKAIFTILAWLLFGAPAFAQSTVVSQCPSTTQIYTAGQSNRTPVLDIFGNACVADANAGGGTVSPAATVITGNAQGTTGAVVGTLAGAATKTTYICGFNVSAIGGTAAIGPVTVAGITGSSQVYQASSAAAGVLLSQTFSPCIPASAVNTSITITTTADGTATAVDVNSWGFRQ